MLSIFMCMFLIISAYDTNYAMNMPITDVHDVQKQLIDMAKDPLEALSVIKNFVIANKYHLVHNERIMLIEQLEILKTSICKRSSSGLLA